jgi:hypothetical protein
VRAKRSWNIFSTHWVLIVHVVYATNGDNLAPASQFAVVRQIGPEELVSVPCWVHVVPAHTR